MAAELLRRKTVPAKAQQPPSSHQTISTYWSHFSSAPERCKRAATSIGRSPTLDGAPLNAVRSDHDSAPKGEIGTLRVAQSPLCTVPIPLQLQTCLCVDPCSPHCNDAKSRLRPHRGSNWVDGHEDMTQNLNLIRHISRRVSSGQASRRPGRACATERACFVRIGYERPDLQPARTIRH
jgi:hypothetical protein